jgi:hypothetical protein
MATAPTHALPAWVKKRDGRVVPFEADCITQTLFAASRRLDRPDAFLARELTDAVLHFFAAEGLAGIPSTADIAELVVKVVRELRQPQLAQALAERDHLPTQRGATEPTPAAVVAQSLRAYSLATVFSPDLAAAQESGLVELGGLQAPLELEAGVLGPPTASVVESFVDARQGVAGWLAVDGPECLAAAADAPAFVAQLALACRATGLGARLQLNVAEPPLWAREGPGGPLFAEPSLLPTSEARRGSAWLDAWLQHPSPALELDWHVGDRITLPDPLLLRLARAALEGRPVTFVFDRPRRPVSLGPGLDRKQPALLLSVGLPLPRLLDHTGITEDVELFLRKLGSLARWAASAAAQKRNFVRQHQPAGAALSRGFLLDRARVLVTPLGLDAAVRRLCGAGLCAGKNALDLGRRILAHLREVLAGESQRRPVGAALEAPDEAWDAPPEQQLRAAGRLHAVTGAGTAQLLLPDDERINAEQVVRWVQDAREHTDVARLRLVRRRPRQDQPQLGMG